MTHSLEFEILIKKYSKNFTKNNKKKLQIILKTLIHINK